MKQMQGMSVIEVVIALLIATLLVGVAAPAAFSAYGRARVELTRLALGESVLTSSRIAVTTGSVAIMCPTDAGGGCSRGSDWSGGWLVFADVDDDRAFGPSDIVVQRQPPLSQEVRLLSNKGRSQIAFQPDGSSSGSNLTFSVCSRSNARAELMVLSNAGRFRVAQASQEQSRACRRP